MSNETKPAAAEKPEQLLMHWFPGTEIPHYEMPEGCSISTFQGLEDIYPWEICSGKTLMPRFGKDEVALLDHSVNLYEDILFLDENGKHVGTVTAFKVKKTGHGHIHQVGLDPECRGRGLSKYMMEAAMHHIAAMDIPFAELTTDDHRVGAVKLYLNFGWVPIMYGKPDKRERWGKLLTLLGIPSCPAYDIKGNRLEDIMPV